MRWFYLIFRHFECHYPHYQGTAFTSRIIQKVRLLRRGRGRSMKSEQKQTGRRKFLASVYVRFFKKNAEIFKIKFNSYFPVFPIDYNGNMNKQGRSKQTRANKWERG